jgi:hypothetical protein
MQKNDYTVKEIERQIKIWMDSNFTNFELNLPLSYIKHFSSIKKHFESNFPVHVESEPPNKNFKRTYGAIILGKRRKEKDIIMTLDNEMIYVDNGSWEYL